MDESAIWVHHFGDAIDGDDDELTRLLGEKGKSLHRMTCEGFNVPPGFTITTRASCIIREAAAHRGFPLEPAAQIAETTSCTAAAVPHLRPPLGPDDRILQEIWQHVESSVARLEKRTGLRFGDAPNPLLLAVRSGAAVSLPGMMETRLNCGSWQVLRQSIEAVVRSATSERVQALLRDRGGSEVTTAVNVQAMIQTDLAGVLFSRHPHDPTSDQMLVEAVRGLGPELVAGRTTPQQFVMPRDLAKDPTHPIDGQHPTSPKLLGSQQLKQLREICLRLERLYGAPVDVEWGFANGRLYLFQARINAAPSDESILARIREEEIDRLRKLAQIGDTLWVRHNLDETLAAPTPLTWEIFRHFMSGAGGMGRMYRQLGYRPSAKVCAEGFLELIAGRIYASPSRVTEMFHAGWPLQYDVAALRQNPSLLENGPTRIDVEKMEGTRLWRWPSIFLTMLTASRCLSCRTQKIKSQFEERSVPCLLEYVQQERLRDLQKLSSDELVSLFNERRRIVLDEQAPTMFLPGFFGSIACSELERQLAERMGPSLGRQTAQALLTGLIDNGSSTWQPLVLNLAGRRANLEELIERFGHRGPNEMELSAPRWREIPDTFSKMIRQIQNLDPGEPSKAVQTAQQIRLQAEADLPRLLSEHGASSFLRTIRPLLTRVQGLLSFRELGKHYWMMSYELVRAVLEELARRWQLGSDLYFLTLAELNDFHPSHSPIRKELPVRRRRWLVVRRLELPEVIDTSNLDEVVRSKPFDDQMTRFPCTTLSQGVASGPVVVVGDPDSAIGLTHHSIIVSATVDPGLTPLLLSARALIVERGGLLSHGAMVARQFGIPAVVFPAATQVLRHGQKIVVDADHGFIATDL